MAEPLTAAERAAIQARLVAIRAALPFGELHPGKRAEQMAARALQVLDDADVLLATVTALEAERDQYAAVVRAARAWFDGKGGDLEAWQVLRAAVAAMPGETHHVD